mgnify:FL=1
MLGGPDGFDDLLAPLPDGVHVRRAARGTNDLVVSFHTRRALSGAAGTSGHVNRMSEGPQ